MLDAVVTVISTALADILSLGFKHSVKSMGKFILLRSYLNIQMDIPKLVYTEFPLKRLLKSMITMRNQEMDFMDKRHAATKKQLKVPESHLCNNRVCS